MVMATSLEKREREREKSYCTAQTLNPGVLGGRQKNPNWQTQRQERGPQTRRHMMARCSSLNDNFFSFDRTALFSPSPSMFGHKQVRLGVVAWAEAWEAAGCGQGWGNGRLITIARGCLKLCSPHPPSECSCRSLGRELARLWEKGEKKNSHGSTHFCYCSQAGNALGKAGGPGCTAEPLTRTDSVLSEMRRGEEEARRTWCFC